jgi:PTS system ascorbate-specific IIC component
MLDTLLSGFRITFGQFELVMGIITLIGLLLQKKKPADVVMGVTKAVVGVMILKQGSTLLQAAYRPVMEILKEAFNISGVITENYSGMAAINTSLVESVLSVVPTVLVLAFLINLVLARISPLKYVFLTCHTLLAMSTLTVWVMHYFFGISGIQLTLTAALFLGIYNTIMPAWVHRYAKPFVGDSFTLGHISGTAAVISTGIGRLLGGYRKNGGKLHDEDEFPSEHRGLSRIFTDSTVVTCLLMTVVLGGISLIAGKEYILEQAGTVNWVVWTIELGASFTVGIVVLLTGVRMMIAELVPAFKGISDKLIPNAVPALDMPVFFPMAPLSAVLGFIGAFIGEFLGFFILLAVGSPVLMIPGIIATFFDGGIAGVFGFKYGGKKAALISGLVCGLIQILGGVFFTQWSGMAALGATYGNTDFGSLWLAITPVMSLLSNVWFFMAIIVAVFVAACFLLRQKKMPSTMA